MSTATEVMAKQKKTKRNDKAVKIERALASKAAVIVEQLGYDSIAEYLSELVRPGVERDWPEALEKLESEKPVESPKPRRRKPPD